MVIFQTPGGSPGYNQFESLDEAVAFVEQLRNERDITNARMFALEEIKFDVRPYYKVEVAALPSGSAAAEAAPAEPVAEAEAEPAEPEPEPEPAAAGGFGAPPPAAPTFGTAPEQPPAEAPAAEPPVREPAVAESAPSDGAPRRGLFGR